MKIFNQRREGVRNYKIGSKRGKLGAVRGRTREKISFLRNVENSGKKMAQKAEETKIKAITLVDDKYCMNSLGVFDVG